MFAFTNFFFPFPFLFPAIDEVFANAQSLGNIGHRLAIPYHIEHSCFEFSAIFATLQPFVLFILVLQT